MGLSVGNAGFGDAAGGGSGTGRSGAGALLDADAALLLAVAVAGSTGMLVPSFARQLSTPASNTELAKTRRMRSRLLGRHRQR
jgi:hypothetical protein